MRSRLRCLLAALAWLAAATRAAAAGSPIVVVAGGDTGPYHEALAGFAEVVGEVPVSFTAQEEPEIPPSARVVVAFGSRAAMAVNAGNVKLIYAMAPAADIPGAIKISMMPKNDDFLLNLRLLDPTLHRLGVLCSLLHYSRYAEELRSAARSQGIEVEVEHLEGASQLPEYLRKFYGKIDALWLTTDPLLLNAEGLPILIEFSRANKIPLLVPTAGLIDQGATASIGPTFREIGRAAGNAARAALRGEQQAEWIFPVDVEMTVNRKAAAQIGLAIPDEALRKASRAVGP